MWKVLFAAVSLLTSAHTWGYPFEVEQTLKEVQIGVQTMNLGDNISAVTLDNYGQTLAQCSVRFRSGPALPVTRMARVEPGQQANVTASFNHQIIRMRVTVNCQPAKK